MYKAIILSVCLIQVPVAAVEFAGGTGEPNDPFQIANVKQLIGMGEDPNLYNLHFILTDDIDLDPNLPGRELFTQAVIAPGNVRCCYKCSPNPFEFKCSSDFTNYFTGSFDGNNHVISNLTIAGETSSGLFGAIAGATVHNLRLKHVAITSSESSAGALAAYVKGGDISYCSANGTVNGFYAVGGLVGVSETYDEGSTQYYSNILLCYTSAQVRGNNVVGGLVGYNQGHVSACYSTGIVTGNSVVGGLIGQNGNIFIQHEYIGGCYSSCKVKGVDTTGGLVGNSWEETVHNCFWDTVTSGISEGYFGTGLPTEKMQDANTYATGWNFDTTWKIWTGYDYPHLQWEPGPNTPLVFVEVPRGTFEMGDHYDDPQMDNEPIHTVRLNNYKISKYEITNTQYAEYLNAAMKDNLVMVESSPFKLGVVYELVVEHDESRGYTFIGPGQPYCNTFIVNSISQIDYSEGKFIVRSRNGHDMGNHPVLEVSWYGAKAFCDYYGYRLPTEAEWEYAARGGYHDPYFKYPWGKNYISCSKANRWDFQGAPCNPLDLEDYPYTSPVGYLLPHGSYGICDMAGNIMEWCHDWYYYDYYEISPTNNPRGPSQGDWPTGFTKKVKRGGAWAFDDLISYECSVSRRCSNWPDDLMHDAELTGFRVCLSSAAQN